MFDVGFGELVALGVIALFVFGPERLPQAAAQAGRLMRELRSMASGARRELGEHIDPDLASVDLRSLDPRSHLRDAVLGRDGVGTAGVDPTGGDRPRRRRSRPVDESSGSRPRVDPDAT